MEVQFGVAKVSKYASHESGDTFEIIERPQGGLSAVLVDGQRSGRSAKIISNLVARKTISLLGEGVRDGAAIRAAHDYLRTHRAGQVSADLQVVSVDLVSHSLVISRNTRCPALVFIDGELQALSDETQPVGIYANTKPVIVELPLAPEIYLVLYTDGLTEAGSHNGQPFDPRPLVEEGACAHWSAQALADAILARALELDQGRPADDIAVLVVAVLGNEVPAGARRLSVSFPV